MKWPRRKARHVERVVDAAVKYARESDARYDAIIEGYEEGKVPASLARKAARKAIEERGDLFNKQWLKKAALATGAVAAAPFVVAGAAVIATALLATGIVVAIGTVVLGSLGSIVAIDPAIILVLEDDNNTWVWVVDWLE